MEDHLWQAAFSLRTELDVMDEIHGIRWNFSNLDKAFEEGGELYGSNVYMFGCTEPQFLEVEGETKVVPVPAVVVVVSPIPSFDKLVVKYVQREAEEIVPMQEMKMAWIPYVPLADRRSQAERSRTQIFVMGCPQRSSTLNLGKTERDEQYDYCLPYVQPLKPDKDEEDTFIHLLYPTEPPILCCFDWESDDLEEFTEDLVKSEDLSEGLKDAFKQYVEDRVRERQRAQQQAKEARQKAVDDLHPEAKAALHRMLVYKFYPVHTPDGPDLRNVKVPYVNRYYGDADVIMSD